MPLLLLQGVCLLNLLALTDGLVIQPPYSTTTSPPLPCPSTSSTTTTLNTTTSTIYVSSLISSGAPSASSLISSGAPSTSHASSSSIATASTASPETTTFSTPKDAGEAAQAAQRFRQTTYWSCDHWPGQSTAHCGWHEPILDASMPNAADRRGIAPVKVVMAVVGAAIFLAGMLS